MRYSSCFEHLCFISRQISPLTVCPGPKLKVLQENNMGSGVRDLGFDADFAVSLSGLLSLHICYHDYDSPGVSGGPLCASEMAVPTAPTLALAPVPHASTLPLPPSNPHPFFLTTLCRSPLLSSPTFLSFPDLVTENTLALQKKTCSPLS